MRLDLAPPQVLEFGICPTIGSCGHIVSPHRQSMRPLKGMQSDFAPTKGMWAHHHGAKGLGVPHPRASKWTLPYRKACQWTVPQPRRRASPHPRACDHFPPHQGACKRGFPCQACGHNHMASGPIIHTSQGTGGGLDRKTWYGTKFCSTTRHVGRLCSQTRPGGVGGVCPFKAHGAVLCCTTRHVGVLCTTIVPGSGWTFSCHVVGGRGVALAQGMQGYFAPPKGMRANFAHWPPCR